MHHSTTRPRRRRGPRSPLRQLSCHAGPPPRILPSGAGSGGAINSLADQPILITRCTFYGNSGDSGGAIGAQAARIANCTFASNHGYRGSAVALGPLSQIDHSIIAFGMGDEPVRCFDTPVTLACCDVFGNEGGDWVGCIAGQEGTNGNLSADPLFCDLRDLRLRPDSPCAPEQNPDCGLIGALPVGCEPPVPVIQTSWGRIKRIYHSGR